VVCALWLQCETYAGKCNASRGSSYVILFIELYPNVRRAGSEKKHNDTADHAMICRHGGLTFICHNELHDITAQLSKVRTDVSIEPPLQPLSGERLTPRTANQQDDARADIHARGFWGQQQSAFFDIRVFHPNAQSYQKTSVSSNYRCHKLQKKREYGDRIREVELA